MLHEAAFVAELVDVLARRALLRVAPFLDGVGPRFVQGHPVAFEYLGEIGPDRVEVDLDLLLVARDLDVPFLDQRQDVPRPDRVADAARRSRSTPPMSERISCSIFIASMMKRICPGAISWPGSAS